MQFVYSEPNMSAVRASGSSSMGAVSASRRGYMTQECGHPKAVEWAAPDLLVDGGIRRGLGQRRAWNEHGPMSVLDSSSVYNMIDITVAVLAVCVA